MSPRFLVLLALVASPLALDAQALDFYARGPYRPAVPRPEVVLGYAAGEQHTMYAQLQRYLDTLVASAPERVRIERWGQTAERRPIRALVISDPANPARLDQIGAEIAELTDPRKTTHARAADIAARDPAIAVFQYSVHGDEPAGLEAAMQVAYQLLASDEPQTLEILKNVVLVLNPSANPDGHGRFAAGSNSVGVGADDPAALDQDEPWSVTGRYNHFRFDMNRDLLAQSQPEVRAMMDGILRWHPQVLVDHHSTTPTFFFPPVAQAVNLNLPPQTTKWFETYGRANAAAFDRMKRIVFTRGGDARTAAHVVGLLLRDGIEVGRLRQPLTSTTAHSYLGGPPARQTFPAGSYVVDLTQPQRRLAKAVLEPQPGFDRGFVERELGKYQRNRRRGDAGEREEYGFYDVTAWALPYTFNLQAWWTEDAAPLSADVVTDTVLPAPPAPARAASAYVFTDDNAGAARLALALQAEGFKLAVALKPLRADGRSWPRGTFVVRVQRNPATLQERLPAPAPALGVAVPPVQSAFADSGAVGVGSDAGGALDAPAILLAPGAGNPGTR